MDGINIKYKILQSSLGIIGSQIKELTKETSQLAGFIEHLDIFWDGDANSAYKVRVFKDIELISETLLKVSELMKTCDLAIGEYQETEKVIMQMIGGFRIEK